MNIVTRAIRRRILDRIDPTVRLVRSPASRTAGGDLMNRIAAVGILRPALRWPALSGVLIVSVLAARAAVAVSTADVRRLPVDL